MTGPFAIFPCGPDKAPLIRDWQTRATRDPAIIARWEAHGAKAFGIPTGTANGLFVIDLDVDKYTGETIGENSLIAMPRFAHLRDHACVITASGGLHIYCQHFEGARNTTSKIGPKIDTRGEGGYVVAPGSVTAGGHYHGAAPETLPPVPIGLRALLLQEPRRIAVKPADRLAPTGEVEALLSAIPADLSYSDWVAVLMGLHHRYGGSEEGLALADRWSASGTKYRPGEVRRKWASFAGEGVRWPTVPAIARRFGADLSEIARRHGGRA